MHKMNILQHSIAYIDHAKNQHIYFMQYLALYRHKKAVKYNINFLALFINVLLEKLGHEHQTTFNQMENNNIYGFCLGFLNWCMYVIRV